MYYSSKKGFNCGKKKSRNLKKLKNKESVVLEAPTELKNQSHCPLECCDDEDQIDINKVSYYSEYVSLICPQTQGSNPQSNSSVTDNTQQILQLGHTDFYTSVCPNLSCRIFTNKRIKELASANIVFIRGEQRSKVGY